MDNNQNDMYEDEESLTRIVEDDVFPMKFFDRVFGIFFSPGKVMENIKQYPKIGAAVIVVLIISAISAIYAMDIAEIALEETTIIYVERYGADYFNFSEVLQTGAGGAGMDLIVNITTIATLLVTPFVMAFIATLVLFIFSKIFRGWARFGQLYTMLFHIYMVTYLLNLIPTAFIVINQSSLNILSLAMFFMPDGNITMPMFNLLSAITIPAIWEAVLIFIGIKILNEWKNGKALAVTALNLGIWVGGAVLIQHLSLMVMDWSFNLMTGTTFF